MATPTVTKYATGKVVHRTPQKGVKGIAREIIDFSLDPVNIANGDTATIQLMKVEAGIIVTNLHVLVETAEGEAFAVEVGDGDNPDGYFDGAVADLNLNSATLQPANGSYIATDKGRYYSADDTIDMVFANSTGSAVTLGTAKIHLFLEYMQK